MVFLQVFGLVWSGPANHYWQAFLEQVFRGRRDAATLCKKVLLDQLTYGPFSNILLMSYIALIVEGAPLRGVWRNFLGCHIPIFRVKLVSKLGG